MTERICAEGLAECFLDEEELAHQLCREGVIASATSATDRQDSREFRHRKKAAQREHLSQAKAIMPLFQMMCLLDGVTKGAEAVLVE